MLKRSWRTKTRKGISMKKLMSLQFVLVFVMATLVTDLIVRVEAGQATGTAQLKSNEISGVVTSSKGPEAGVWVIAETTDLPTRFIKIVVTDEQGRYVLPELPQANYQGFVRGYGLVYSAKLRGEPGKLLDLKPTVAPDVRTAAQYYPANY